MSSGKNPLVLMMALSMPGAAHALGLGDIHVDSALNERFAAEIDIVGATALELADLKAAVANRETFLRFGADRPAFLTSTTFKVTQDSHGRPVLAARSSESFTEPVVNFLVDLNWHNGQLIRQYTLLLDPAGFAAAPTPVVTPAPAIVAPPVAAADAPAVVTAPQAAAAPAAAAAPEAAPATRKLTHIKVGAKATLRGVAWRAGERSESDLQRMMVAIFRANPTAFDGNINRLHLGALLTIPSRAEAAMIPKAEARHEIRAQMAAWRSPTRRSAAATVAAAPPAANPAAAAMVTPAAIAAAPAAEVETPVAKVADNSPESLAAAALDHRVQSLEQELNQMQGLLQSERGQLLALQRQAALDPQPAAAVNPPPTQRRSASMAVALFGGLGALGAALLAAFLGFRRRRSTNHPRSSGSATGTAPVKAPALAEAVVGSMAAAPPPWTQDHDSPPNLIAAQDPAPGQSDSETDVIPALDPDATQPALPALPDVEPAGRSEIATIQPPSSSIDDTTINAPHEATVNMSVQTVNLRMDSTRLDYNFLDLEQTAQHVQMPSVLNQGAVVKERRTNLADVLKMAIEREPDRQDLRMKLLELYYSAAATNRKAFLDVVQKLARDRDHLQAEQWDKIAFMGRQIAGENPLFAEQASDEDLADCA